MHGQQNVRSYEMSIICCMEESIPQVNTDFFGGLFVFKSLCCEQLSLMVVKASYFKGHNGLACFLII